MNLNNYELVERLAAEYVLGTLRGPARQRFERWRATSIRVDAHCRLWEERLLPLAATVRPMRPRARVWDGISTTLHLSPALKRRTVTWRQALAAGVLLATAGSLLYWQSPGVITQQAALAAPSRPAGSALVPAWRIEVHTPALGHAELVIRTASLTQHAKGRDYELWALPKGGSPVSLGVLPASAGVTTRALRPEQFRALAAATTLAVSMEPTGGSPTGAPTGPVVETGALVRSS